MSQARRPRTGRWILQLPLQPRSDTCSRQLSRTGGGTAPRASLRACFPSCPQPFVSALLSVSALRLQTTVKVVLCETRPPPWRAPTFSRRMAAHVEGFPTRVRSLYR
jgi:hypothetical protein